MKVIEHITLVLAFFSASFYAMAENKMRSGKLMSKEELTQKYDKNDNGQLDYREKMAFLKSLNLHFWTSEILKMSRFETCGEHFLYM